MIYIIISPSKLMKLVKLILESSKTSQTSHTFFSLTIFCISTVLSLESMTLKSLAKVSRVVLQDDSLVELIGMERFLRKVDKHISALACFDRCQLLGLFDMIISLFIPDICYTRHRCCLCKIILPGVNFSRLNAKKEHISRV